MIYVEDKRLLLPDGRTLAYADNGNTSSSIIVLFFHGAFGVGDASRLPPALSNKAVHLIAPSLPGWGRTSPVPNPYSFGTTLLSDISALLTYIHPRGSKYKLYIAGHSFGCISAQILYGASYAHFVQGRQIAGLVLLAPHSPPHCHSSYSRLLSWPGYLMTGPPSQCIPFNLLARLAQFAMADKLKDVSSAETLFRKHFFDHMSENEEEAFAQWREMNEVDAGQLEQEWARNAARSVAHTWQGFLDMPAIYHSGWEGFSPDQLDEEHSTPPVVIITATADHQSPRGMAEWLAVRYKHATLKVVDGGHLAAFCSMDDVWRELLE